MKDFLLASDRDRRERVHLINWQWFLINVVQPVVVDDVTEMRSLRTGRGDEIRIALSTPELARADTEHLVNVYMGLSKETPGL